MLLERSPRRGPVPPAGPRPALPAEAVARIATLLSERTGLDFHQYKPSFLQRRLSRELYRHGLSHAGDYLRRIREGDRSAADLVGELTVHVTRFFRDPPLFSELKERFFPLLAREDAAARRAEFRIWVVGCSTGEEASSAAITYLEATRTLPGAPRPRIFATDVDPAVIARARRGRYTVADLAPVPAALRYRYFEGEDATRVRPEVRRLITFGLHDLLQNAYIHHLEVIFCRNVLIFLDRSAQRRIFDRLVQALEPRGLLVLGRAESPPPPHRDRTLVTVARHVRIYGLRETWGRESRGGGAGC